MPKIQFNEVRITAPVWAGEFVGAENLIPNGSVLEASEFTADAEGRKFVASGTLIGRTYAERDTNKGFGPADVATDNEIFLLAFDVYDANEESDCELYRHQRLVKENFLPNWAAMTAAQKTKIRSLYQCILGTP